MQWKGEKLSLQSGITLELKKEVAQTNGATERKEGHVGCSNTLRPVQSAGKEWEMCQPKHGDKLNMTDTDVDVGILFQRKELEDLISALETSKFIANMMAFPTNQRGELNAALEDWEHFEQSEKINEHLKVLREIRDNEAKHQEEEEEIDCECITTDMSGKCTHCLRGPRD